MGGDATLGPPSVHPSPVDRYVSAFAGMVGRLCGACESTRWRLSRTGTGVELGWDREKHGMYRVDVHVERQRSSCTSC